MKKIIKGMIAAALLTGAVSAAIIDFEDQAITNPLTPIAEQYADLGVHFSALNNNAAHPQFATLYNTDGTGGRDSDLEFTTWKEGWNDGNAADVRFGKALIIAENYNLPDDEAAGGEIYLEFDYDISSFGFSLIDIDDDETAGSITFSGDGVADVTYSFASLATSDNGIVYGNRTANIIDDIDLEGMQVNKVTFTAKHSLAIGGISYAQNVPEPGIMALLGMSILGFFFSAKARRKKD